MLNQEHIKEKLMNGSLHNCRRSALPDAMLSSSQQTVQRAALEALAKLAWGNRQTCDAVMSAGRSMQSLERL